MQNLSYSSEITLKQNASLLRTQLSPCREQILRLACKLTCNREDAEDLVQDTLLRAWTYAETFRGTPTQQAVLRWLAVILRNRFYNLRGRVGKEKNIVLLFDEELMEPSPQHREVALDICYEQRQSALAMLEAMERLPASQRNILDLVAFEYLSYEEISERLRLPVGTVRSRLHRARARVARATFAWT